MYDSHQIYVLYVQLFRCFISPRIEVGCSLLSSWQYSRSSLLTFWFWNTVFESLIESQLPFRPSFYKRYVDEIFAIFYSRADALTYLSLLNSRHPNIQFTMESETNGSLNFLDVNVFRSNNTLLTKWILKSINTGRYIPSHAYSPNRYKQNAVRYLIFRSTFLNTRVDDYKASYNLIKEIFKNNGYSDRYIDEIKRSVDASAPKPPPATSSKYVYWRLPYIKSKEIPTLKAVNSINKILPITHRLRVVFKTFKTVDIFSNKDRVQTGLASNVVYKFQCEQCPSCYVGETRRHLSTRIK